MFLVNQPSLIIQKLSIHSNGFKTCFVLHQYNNTNFLLVSIQYIFSQFLLSIFLYNYVLDVSCKFFKICQFLSLDYLGSFVRITDIFVFSVYFVFSYAWSHISFSLLFFRFFFSHTTSFSNSIFLFCYLEFLDISALSQTDRSFQIFFKNLIIPTEQN